MLPVEVNLDAYKLAKQNDLSAIMYHDLMMDNIDEVTDVRLKALKEIEKDKVRVAKAYNKKVKSVFRSRWCTCIFASYLSRDRNQAAVDENVEKLKKVLEVYEARLSQSKYLAGDFLSLADLSHFTIMHYFMATEYATLVEALPHDNARWEGLAARPAAKKVAEFMPVDAPESPKKQE
ncbi:glutathione S-transferase 4-like [Miscanthus floridulus]|uniref:glutathione S-transferase 4-like n=1 Tax=Miscanthus floridulus TaxID=154761 RepID=UPI003457BE7F